MLGCVPVPSAISVPTKIHRKGATTFALRVGDVALASQRGFCTLGPPLEGVVRIPEALLEAFHGSFESNEWHRLGASGRRLQLLLRHGHRDGSSALALACQADRASPSTTAEAACGPAGRAEVEQKDVEDAQGSLELQVGRALVKFIHFRAAQWGGGVGGRDGLFVPD